MGLGTIWDKGTYGVRAQMGYGHKWVMVTNGVWAQVG